MHKLLARQLAKATESSGELDLQALLALVAGAYQQSDDDRHRTDRSISLMIKELDQLNRGLDQLVQERTAALREREAELQAQNFRFDAALKNMAHGICMFDRNECLIVCNERYTEMYALAPDLAKPGAALRSILEARVAGPKGPLRADRYIEDRLADVRKREPFDTEIDMRDGRVLAVNHRPMPGGGWVAIHQDITAQKRAELQIAYMARHDDLTGLANRAVLLKKMEEALARVRSHDGHFTLFMLDLDLFKTVNDSLGHPVGDELLKLVASRLVTCVYSTDTVARLGGDEFAILANVDGDPREAATITAKKLLSAVAVPYDIDGHQLNIGTSIGIALAPEHGNSVDQLVKNADLALYKAKAEGRDAYRFFDDAMGTEARRRRAYQNDLRNALSNDEFEVHYHPIVDIQTREIASVEALIRWRHPERGLIAPADFIQVAEETGLINPIGNWVLRKACSDATRWPAHIKVSVNLSAVQFRKVYPIDNFCDTLAESGLPPERLELEITEFGPAAGHRRERRNAASAQANGHCHRAG